MSLLRLVMISTAERTENISREMFPLYAARIEDLGPVFEAVLSCR
jgi:hypothetical protein